MQEEMKEKVEKEFKPDYDAFRLARTIKLVPAKDPSMIKWQCSKGCTIVRVSKNVVMKAECHVCLQMFVRDPDAIPIVATL
jgi:hypothetical protein